VARHACRGSSKLALIGICSGSWFAAQVARNIGAQEAILVNPMVWSWRVIPTLVQQWDAWRNTRHTNAASNTGGGPFACVTNRLKALINAGRGPTRSFIHNHLPRYVLRVLSWVGLVYLPEDVLTTLAHRGNGVTLIMSPSDAEEFTARGGRTALDRLQRTSRPPCLIVTSTGDHSAHHPAILAAIRNAVLPVAASSSRSQRDRHQTGVGA